MRTSLKFLGILWFLSIVVSIGTVVNASWILWDAHPILTIVLISSTISSVGLYKYLSKKPYYES